MRARLGRIGDPRASERGSALVEILVTTMVLAIVSAGVFATLNRASATSGEERARGAAALVAEQDQERLRSMNTTQLSNRRETRTVTVSGVAYTVTSRVDWTSDQSGTLSCTNTTGRADYMKTSSTVTWPAMAGAKPVKAESLVAPRNFTGRGNLSVRILNRDAAGSAGITVAVNGSQSFSDTTDDQGCVYFAQIPTGSYTVAFASAGWVTPDGVSGVSDPATITNGNTTTKNYEYDRAGSLDLRFDTKVGNAAPFAQTGEYVTVGHSRIATPRVFGNGTAQSSIAANGLYPFSSPYGLYSGNCAANDPSNYGETAATAVVDPGVGTTVTVREPALNLRVTRSGTVRSGARVEVDPQGSGCGGDTFIGLTNANGALDNPGLPYEYYDICAELQISGTWRYGRRDDHPVIDPDGSPVANVDMSNSGRC